MPKPWKKNLDTSDDDGSTPRSLHTAVVAETLDLHGYTADEAEQRLELFFDRVTRTSAGEVVRIVTGRGARSAGPPVLQGLVRDALNGWLADAIEEWAVDVGGGAFLARVRG
jgi:DNA-nicking Smr family endonuclease